MKELGRVMTSMDIDTNGVITFDEFVTGVHDYCLTSTLSRTRTANTLIHTEIDQFSDFFTRVYYFVADGVNSITGRLRPDVSFVQSQSVGVSWINKKNLCFLFFYNGVFRWTSSGYHLPIMFYLMFFFMFFFFSLCFI